VVQIHPPQPVLIKNALFGVFFIKIFCGLWFVTRNAVAGSKFVYENKQREVRITTNLRADTNRCRAKSILKNNIFLNHRKRWFTTSESRTEVRRFPEVLTKGNERSCRENFIFAKSIQPKFRITTNLRADTNRCRAKSIPRNHEFSKNIACITHKFFIYGT